MRYAPSIRAEIRLWQRAQRRNEDASRGSISIVRKKRLLFRDFYEEERVGVYSVNYALTRPLQSPRLEGAKETQ